MAESPRKLRVGLVGGGTVGGGIVTILEGARELQASLGVDVEIATIWPSAPDRMSSTVPITIALMKHVVNCQK